MQKNETSRSRLYMSMSLLSRSEDICSTVVQLRFKAAALAATLAAGSLWPVDGRPDVVRGDLPPRDLLPFAVVDVDVRSDDSNFSTSTFFANNSS